MKLRFIDRNCLKTTSSLMLSMVACMSFMAHLFFYSLSPTIYMVLLLVLTLCFILCKPIVVPNLKIVILLMTTALYMIFSFWNSKRLTGSLIDVLVLLLGMLFVFFYTKKIGDYDGVLKVISFFAMFFSIGTIMNSLMPQMYRFIISKFPSTYAAVVKQQIDRVPGFSTNPGFSAGYISAGIIVLVSLCHKKKSISKKEMIRLVILFGALLFTGKRGPTIFLVITLLLCYLIPINGMKKINRYWKMFFLCVTVIVIYFVLKDFLVVIPAISEISKTISGLLEGDDISSGRNSLYAWAFRLFLLHPLFGIGWGNYKTTVVGNATLVKELDVHNIYLQLLCETGITGFIIIVGMFFWFWNKTKRLYIQCFKRQDSKSRELLPYIFFSFAYQTCFLIFGLTGNTLYDQHYQILYMISCAIMMTYNNNNSLYYN